MTWDGTAGKPKLDLATATVSGVPSSPPGGANKSVQYDNSGAFGGLNILSDGDRSLFVDNTKGVLLWDANGNPLIKTSVGSAFQFDTNKRPQVVATGDATHPGVVLPRIDSVAGQVARPSPDLGGLGLFISARNSAQVYVGADIPFQLLFQPTNIVGDVVWVRFQLYPTVITPFATGTVTYRVDYRDRAGPIGGIGLAIGTIDATGGTRNTTTFEVCVPTQNQSYGFYLSVTGTGVTGSGQIDADYSLETDG